MQYNGSQNEISIRFEQIMIKDLKSLELFVRVAKLGAIGKAGAEFGLSPTAATQRIQSLEASVGTQLLHRSTRSISLSSDGETFFAHAERILENLADALSDIQASPQKAQGKLRIAGPASFGRRFIAPYIGEFLDLNPNVSVQLHLSDGAFDIVDNGYDIAIRLGVLSPSSLKAWKLADSPRILVASPQYLEHAGTPTSTEDLCSHQCIIRDEMRTWRLRTPDGSISDIKVNGRFSSNLAEAVTEAALSGAGIARKCAWEISELMSRGRLVQVLADHTVEPAWKVYAVRPPSRIEPPRVRIFKAFIASKYSEINSLRID